MQKNKGVPKVINYFWFGNNPMPEEVKDCIASWRKFCPSYKIVRWDESNFNVNECNYVREAYIAKKWAFVSDYARFKILYEYGGIYLDTDVKLIKNIDSIINNGAFFALENTKYDSIGTGLGMGVEPKNRLYKKILTYYQSIHFQKNDGTYDETPINLKIKKYFLNYGLKNIPGIQKIKGITIYPKDYFCPLDYETGKLNITPNTVAIHLYLGSWLSPQEKALHNLQKKISKIIGRKAGILVINIIRKPISAKNKIDRLGIKGTINYYKDKFHRL